MSWRHSALSALWYQESRSGDVLIIRNGDGNGTVVAKRVIAVAGDTVSVDDYGHVTLNGIPPHEPEVLYGYQPGEMNGSNFR